MSELLCLRRGPAEGGGCLCRGWCTSSGRLLGELRWETLPGRGRRPTCAAPRWVSPTEVRALREGRDKVFGDEHFHRTAGSGRFILRVRSCSGRRSVALPLPSACLPRKRNQPGSKKHESYASCFATQDLGRTISCHLFLPRSWGRQCWGWERRGGGCRLTSPSCSSMALLLRLGCSLLALSTCLLPRVRADCGRDCAACAYRLGPRASIHPLVSGSGAGEAARPLQLRGDP